VAVSLYAYQSRKATEPTGEKILQNTESQLDRVQDYTVTVDIIADIERLNVPPMHATLYFKQPDKVHIDAQGFALLPREGLAFNLRKLLAHYVVAGVERDTSGGDLRYHLTLAGKSTRTPMKNIEMFVRGDRWTVEKLVTPQAGDREMTATFSYTSVKGIWLPSSMVASFSLSQPDSLEEDPLQNPAVPRRQPSFHNGTITVTYSEYQVNTGLGDDMFKADSLKQTK
jgi:hypothetical protein